MNRQRTSFKLYPHMKGFELRPQRCEAEAVLQRHLASMILRSSTLLECYITLFITHPYRQRGHIAHQRRLAEIQRALPSRTMSTNHVSSFFDLQDSFYKSYNTVEFDLALRDSRKPRTCHPTVTAVPPPSPVIKSPIRAVQHHQLTSLPGFPPLQQPQTRKHGKLDCSMSEHVTQQQFIRSPPSSASSHGGGSIRYKTELCRVFKKNDFCEYGDACQFAHGNYELRSPARHPKYKTKMCHSFHTSGYCLRGPHCLFIHNIEESKGSLGSSLHCQQLSENDPHVPPSPRPKALSLGNFNLESVKNFSSSSSLTASPTSWNSFSSDYLYNSPQHHLHHPPACKDISFSQNFDAAFPKLSVDFLNLELNSSSVGVECGGGPVSYSSRLGPLRSRLPIFSRLTNMDSK